MTPVTFRFVIPQNQNKRFKWKSFQQKSCDNFNVGLSNQCCILVNCMWRNLNQSLAGILHW